MAFEIIDFHTHPFIDPLNNICNHKDYCGMSPENTREIFAKLGISTICGSVVCGRSYNDRFPTLWEKIRFNNDTALALKEQYGDFYIPGFHIHPAYPEESVGEIREMHKKGVRLIGELVPYMDGWKDYSCGEFSALLDEAGRHNMVISFHSSGDDEMDAMVRQHRDVVFVAAHPGEYDALMRHIERMKMSENYYLDLSGTGLFRYGMLRRIIDDIGADRILFGSDFPTCNPAMFLGGVLFDPLITDTEKEKIFCGNAKNLLGL